MKKIIKDLIRYSLISILVVNGSYLLLKNIFSCIYYSIIALISVVISFCCLVFINFTKIKKISHRILYLILFNIFNFCLICLLEFIPYPISLIITQCDGGMFSGLAYAIYFLYCCFCSFIALLIAQLFSILKKQLTKKK